MNPADPGSTDEGKDGGIHCFGADSSEALSNIDRASEGLPVVQRGFRRLCAFSESLRQAFASRPSDWLRRLAPPELGGLAQQAADSAVETEART